MSKNVNRNIISVMDSRYEAQQTLIKSMCKDLGLVVYYPNYHAKKNDKNTVIIYTKEGHEYNETLPNGASVDQEKGRVCEFENSDANNHFDLNWMNHGTIDLRNSLEPLKAYLKEKLCQIRN